MQVATDPQVLQALSEINRSIQSSNHPNYLVAIIGMLGVLFGSLCTGIIQLLIARQTANNENSRHYDKLKADIVTRQRQEWLDSIRKASADLLAEYDLIQLTLHDVIQLKTEEHIKYIISTKSKLNLIIMMLNPSDPKQKLASNKLACVSNSITNLANNPSPESKTQLIASQHEAMQALIDVFQETWNQIKNLE